jgi:hypothetical protein
MTCFANINLGDIDYGRLKKLSSAYRIRGVHVFGSPPDTSVADRLSEVLGVKASADAAGFTGVSIQVEPSERSEEYAEKMKRDFSALSVQFGFRKTLATSSESP